MGHYRPSFADPSRPDDSRTVVRTPAGDELAVVDPALAAELGDGVRVIKQNRGVFDAMPLSLISTQSVAALGALVGAELDVQRFRPNLLIEAAGEAGFPEEAWLGAVLRIGAMRMRVDQQDERCDGRAQSRGPVRARPRARRLRRRLRLDRRAGAGRGRRPGLPRLRLRPGSARGRWSARVPARARRSRAA